MLEYHEMMGQVSIPVHAKIMLTLASVLSAPNFIGPLTKTKVWCAITGRCEIGGANYPDLIASAVFNGLFLGLLFVVVLHRRSLYIMLFGAVFLSAVALTVYAFLHSPVDGRLQMTTIDMFLTLSVLYIGASLIAYSWQLFLAKQPESRLTDNHQVH
jgi:hypothetical protein